MQSVKLSSQTPENERTNHTKIIILKRLRNIIVCTNHLQLERCCLITGVLTVDKV